MIQVHHKIAGLKLALAEVESDISEAINLLELHRLTCPEVMNTEEYKANTILVIELIENKLSSIKAELQK